jgi:propanediol dehydratase large subunit
MARTRAGQSEPQDASQEPRAGETPLEQGKAREVNEVDAQLTGAEDLLNVEPARVSGDLIQGSGLVNGSGNAVGSVNGRGSARG